MPEYYVYLHLDPISLKVRYIGKGKGQRAYNTTKRYGHHHSWLISLKRKGLEPEISILHKNLTDSEAKG